MNRVLVTGVNGFTGRHLARRLRTDNFEVHGVVHAPDAENVEGVTALHVAALSDLQQLSKVVAEVQPTHVVHLAAIAFVAHDDVEDLYRTNVVGTRNLLQALATAATKPDLVLLASSANIYGNKREGALDEETTPEPANDYGVSKVAMEMVARIYGDRLPIGIVRPFNYTGVGQAANFVIPKIVEHAKARRATIELGNLDVERDFSDVRTVVDCYARLLATPAAAGGVFNVCSERALSLRDIIAEVERLSQHTMEIRVNPAFVRANEVRSLYGSRRKLESVIGPVEMPPLAETLRWMLDAKD